MSFIRDVAIHQGPESSDRGLAARSKPEEEPSIKFHNPLKYKTFSPFARLPTEIRHQIWESTLTVPGMQFLRINPAGAQEFNWRWWIKTWDPAELDSMGSSDGEDDDDEIVREVKKETRPGQTQSARLMPLYPTPKADISYYTTLNKQLTKLSVTCTEALGVAKRQASRPSVLELDSGRVISLDCRSDVVYLEYAPPDIFEGACYFTKGLDCPGLDKISRVAVRYCHKWHEPHPTRRCPHCGRVHGGSDKVTYPKHLYQFIARYLPNLEHFYFVDYLILRKPSCEEGQMDVEGQGIPKKKVHRPMCKFEGGNRTYHEVDEEDWNITSKVFDMRSWLQDRFVRYAKKSKLSKHKNPEKVEFGVLACEWTVGPPEEVKKAPATPVKKGRNKRAFCEEHTMRRNRRVSYRQTPSSAMSSPQAQITSDLPFVFGSPEGNNFEFTFQLPS
ncbi:Fc.00g008290.m01.CDS01 [Cosmosporella sp. VM-42]